jgi:hypothetical protein
MIPDPASIRIEDVPRTVLFPTEVVDSIFRPVQGDQASPLFGPMWEYSGRRDYRYIFMTPDFLNLLHLLKKHGIVRGVQAEFGCSPWPATNIWFDSPKNAQLPDEIKYAFSEMYWARKYTSDFTAMKADCPLSSGKSENSITRLLVDCHFRVHELAGELSDRPVTAEMDLRAFNNPSDAVYGNSDLFHDPSAIGFRMGAAPATLDRLRQLNDLSLGSAKRRMLGHAGDLPVASGPFINGAVLSSIFNYIPWKAFLKKLDESLLPGGLLMVYNAQEGERAHVDWQNLAEDQDIIADFIRSELGYRLRIHELRNPGGPVSPLYLVAQKDAHAAPRVRKG